MKLVLASRYAVYLPQARRVPVARPVPVHVLYATAVVGDDGLVRFHPDIYGRDGARRGT